MNIPELNPEQTRIIGCLLEKSVVTPDQYPLTLNALTNACNQKSSRDPVMSLSQGEVQHAVRELESKSLVSVEENFKRGVEKYKHRFCNTGFSELQFTPAQFAVITLLLLRGAQTPGELKSRSGRLHEFSDHQEVVETLDSLLDFDGSALIVKLPRQPGRKDSEYMHLFSGEIDVEEYASQAPPPRSSEPSLRELVMNLQQRVEKLEQELSDLRSQ
jgi:uncharacterized protein YceH (UPF0502 family)